MNDIDKNIKIYKIYFLMHFRCLRLALALLAIVLGASETVSAQNIAIYQDSVSSLQRDGIINKGPIVDLRLLEGINRAEALKVILKAQPQYSSSLSSIASSMPPISLFPDVDQHAWYAPYIEVAFQSRLITGYPDGNFRPEYGVSVEEAAIMLARAIGEDMKSAPFATSNDLRNEQGQWYTGALSILIARNAVMPGSNLEKGINLSRGEFFDIVERMRASHGNSISNQQIQPTVQQPSEQVFIGEQNQNLGNVQVIDDSAALQYASKKSFAISIPSLSITDLTITHPKDAFSQDGVLEILKNGVGHLFAYPGEGSKIMIYGHSSGYPWDLSKYTKIFRTINKISIGSRVYVTHSGKVFVYQVIEKKTIPAKDRSIFEAGDKKEELILYTCWPPDSIAERYIVRAVPVETIALR